MGRSDFSKSACLAAIAFFFATGAQAIGRVAVPRVRPPSFPLEPAKKPETRVDPKSYVEGATEAPEEPEELIPRYASESEWNNFFELGWSFAGRTGKKMFRTALGKSEVARSQTSNPLSFSGKLETRPPWWWMPVTVRVKATTTTGQAEVTPANETLSRTLFQDYDYRVGAGLRVHVLPRRWRFDFAVGADYAMAFFSQATMTQDQLALDVENVSMGLLSPYAMFRYSPNPNWSAETIFTYPLQQFVSATGDKDSSDFRRFEVEVSAVRYITTGNALGLGLKYMEETLLWKQTAPVALQDDSLLRDIRVNVFWRRDF